MAGLWESIFRENQEMFGLEPTDAAIAALALFKKHGLTKILIPGFGYGRNAKIFTDNGFDITGIEISKTAIDLAKKHYGNNIKIHHGSVSEMPFDQEIYDGIFCYALIHLLSTEERIKLIKDCYNQLKPNGYMVFIVISKIDARFGRGRKISTDTFEMQPGLSLYFYDAESVKAEFGNYGLIEANEINEPVEVLRGQLSQQFLQIICKK